jgi:transcriptional regulator with XRE-family HTH domain
MSRPVNCNSKNLATGIPLWGGFTLKGKPGSLGQLDICMDIHLIPNWVSSGPMRGGELIREARKRARLSQRELAERIHTTQTVIARWETGQRSPSFERVINAVRACGLEVAVGIVTPDDQHASLVKELLSMSPGERLDCLAKSRRAIEELVSAARKNNQ